MVSLLGLILAPPAAQAQPGHEVGNIPGSFDVTLSGSAGYSIPIRIAPGTAGTEPRIALTYDSQAPGGSLGAGWSVSGLSVITRGPKNLLTDGALDAVRLEESDALFLDGQRLIPIAQTGAGAARRIEYRKETDDQSRIVQTGADFASSVFLVETKGGLRILFDGAHNSRGRFQDGSVLLVAASRISDTTGNYIEFRYRTNGQGDNDIESIRYTGHEERDATGSVRNNRRPYASIEFTYDTAPRPSELYVAGRLSHRTSRLKSITSRVSPERDDAPGVSWSTVARYELEYEERDTANRFVLARVRQFGEDGSELTPTVFDYSAPQVGWQPAPFQLPIPALAGREQLGAAYRFARFAPGAARRLPDILFAAQLEGGTLEAFAFRNDGGTWTRLDGFRPPFPFASSDGTDLGALVADVNGDGRVDLIRSYTPRSGNPESHAFLAGTDRWEPADGYRLPFTLREEGGTAARHFFGRFTGAAGPDLIYDTGNSRSFLANTGSGWRSEPRYAPPVALGPNSRLLDVDCNGTPELVTSVPGAGQGGGVVWKVYRFDTSGWIEITAPAFSPPFPAATNPDAVMGIDLNLDGCQDLIVAGGGARQAFLASPSGWRSTDTKAPPFDLVDATGISAGAVVADVDADGRPDVIAHRRVPNAAPIRFAFRQTDTEWEPLPDAFVPPALGDLNPGAAPVRFFVGDIDGDGRPDVVLPSGHRSSFGRVYAGTANGFAEEPDYVPPVSFSRRDQEDRGVRFIDLNADGLPDVVFRRDVAKDGATTQIQGAFLNRGGDWEEAPGLVPPLPLAADHITGNPAQFVDVDGDGYIDLLYSFRRSDGTVVRTYYRNEPTAAGQREPRRWVEQASSGLAPPSGFPFAAQGVGDLGTRFADLNGDGRVDMLVGILPAASSRPAETCRTVNGRRVCELNRSVFSVAAFINDGNAWVPTPSFNPPLPFVFQPGPSGRPSQDLWVQTVDVDGDGLPDIVAAFRHPWDSSRIVQEVWFNTGTGWRISPNQILPSLPGGSPLLLDEPLRDPRVLFQWVDVNGDGLADIVFSRRQGGSNGSATWLSTGRGFVHDPRWRLPLDAIGDRGGDPTFRLIDVNGDGFVDLLYARKLAGDQVARGLYVNDGSTWAAVDAKLAEGIPPFVDEQGADQGVRLIDVDGNGLVDVVQAFASGAGSEVSEAAVLLNAGRRADVLVGFDAGYNLRTTLTYQTLLEASTEGTGLTPTATAPWQRVYEPGVPAAYPIISPVPATYVVRRAAVDEGGGRVIGFSYRYGDFRLDARARRPLGFGWRESLNEASGVLTRTEMVQDARVRSLPQRDATCWLRLPERPHGEELPASLCPSGPARWSAWAQKLSESENRWEVVEGTVGGGAIPQRTMRQVHMAASSSRAYELDGSPISWQTETFEYDAPASILARRLNALRTRTERGDGTSVETTNEYGQDDEARWFFGRLTRSTVVKVGDPVRPGARERHLETRVATFAYNPLTGLLSEGTADWGHEKAVTTRYERDLFGNVAATTVLASGEDPRTSRNEFDVLGRFAVVEVNPLGHRKVWDPRLTTGAPNRIVDANGRATHYEYDGFGRLRREISPNGVISTSSMLPPNQITDAEALRGLRVAYALRTQVEGLPPALELYDNKGRLIRKVTDGFMRDGVAPRPVEHDTVYDLLGRIVQASVPRERGSETLWTYAKYDVLDRLVESRAVSGATTRRQYRSRADGGSTAEVIDPLGRMSLTESNMRGLAVASTDAQGGATRHEYDAADRLLVSTGPTGAATRHVYDAVGRRIETQDPDLGVWRYAYDAFGRVIRQEDSNGQITTVEYDLLGRPVRKIQADATWSWEYDRSRHGIGQVAAALGSDGYREDFHYDVLGRLSRWAVTIDREHFVTTTDYDRLGRVSRIHYPTSVSIENVYDAKGFHTGVRDLRTGNAYWTVENVDALGRVVAEAYGNGVSASRTFDTATGRPMALRASTKAGGEGADVLDLSLRYDLVGNLLNREERVENIRESFEYDPIDRLAARLGPNGRRDRYAFDAAGRITFRSGVGDYVYYAPSVAAPESGAQAAPFHGVVATLNGGRTREYEYDRSGNMIRAPGVHYEYTADNRIRSVFANQWRWIRFDHAPDGRRYRQFARTGPNVTETLYIGGYERITDFAGSLTEARRGGLVRHRHHLLNATGVFATIETNTEYSDILLSPTPEANSMRAAAEAANRDHGHATGGSAAVTRNGAAGAERSVRATDLPDRSAYHARKVWYLHKDQLGSVIRITDEQGRRAAAFWYDPWGKRTSRINDDPLSPRRGQALASSWDRGFTGHEHFDDFSLIHMNGRVYDAALATFTSVDLVNQALTDTQTGNGYAYARGNPLRYIDPSGYSFWDSVSRAIGDAFGAVAQGFGHLLNETGKWLKENWRQVVIVAAVITVSVFVPGGGTLAGAILQGMAAGATGGALGAALYGGSFEDVLAGAVKGAVIGAFSGAAVHGIGAAFGGSSALNRTGAILGRGTVEGAAAGIRGRNFWRGFAVGAATAGSAAFLNFGTAGLDTAKAAIVGGATSAISGDKFANGAVLAVFAAVYRGSLATSIAEVGISPRAVVKAVIDVAGKLWNLPNTYIGFAYGVLGHAAGILLGTNPEITVGNNSVQFFNNPFAYPGAVTLGNATVFRGALNQTGADGNPFWQHEMQHTYQGQLLGPLYLPSNLLGGLRGLIGGDDWNPDFNWNERGPQQKPPRPW
ncbi:FG-GAP-like repeat-containing protein [Azospirillum argentinense]|uniref:FG-GAP-like repeat-containing protein n=1 Tax=Azospirillum argentinense TaxID=2970906 RepID=UPI001FFF8B91|nr:FG-GAP-like repeat-containing protein [Azospirillum argentinense]